MAAARIKRGVLSASASASVLNLLLGAEQSGHLYEAGRLEKGFLPLRAGLYT